jgi:hypothetical protein
VGDRIGEINMVGGTYNVADNCSKKARVLSLMQIKSLRVRSLSIVLV